MIDLTNFFLLYGLWCAIGAVLFGIAVVLWIGRGRRWFMPGSFLGWAASLMGVAIAAIGIFTLAVFVVFGVHGKSNALRAMMRSEGDPAPTMQFTRLADSATASTADYAGKVLLINFWATWCPPCIEEMPELAKVAQQYADRGLVVLHLSDESAETVATWLKENPMPTEHGVFGAEMPLPLPFNASQQGRPVSFLIDAEGTILETALGRLTEDDLESWMQKAF